MDIPTRYIEDHDLDRRRKIRHAILALVCVVAFGTLGFMIIEPSWGFWKSFYFTLITITTVGYSDYDLRPEGLGFTTIVLVVGIATATYAFGQIVQVAVSYQFAWRRRMQKNIDRLHNHLIVCGLGRVGKTVCARLSEAAIPFVVIEKDHNQFQWARAHGYLTINGEATEDEILLQAGVERARGIVCAVDSDSENIVITLSARELNPNVVIISRADDESAVHKIKRAGASHVISPALKGGDDIANMLVKPHLTEFLAKSHGVESEYTLGEVMIDPHSSLAGQTLREYGAGEQSLVFVAVKRNDKPLKIRPAADEAFLPHDIVIVVGKPEAVLRMSDAASPAPVYA